MLEDCGGGPMARYRKGLDEFNNVTSTNKGFRTVHHSAATYEQTKKGLSYFYPKTIVVADGISHSSFEFVSHFIVHSNFSIEKFNYKGIVTIHITCHSFKLLSYQLFQTLPQSYYIAQS